MIFLDLFGALKCSMSDVVSGERGECKSETEIRQNVELKWYAQNIPLNLKYILYA